MMNYQTKLLIKKSNQKKKNHSLRMIQKQKKCHLQVNVTYKSGNFLKNSLKKKQEKSNKVLYTISLNSSLI